MSEYTNLRVDIVNSYYNDFGNEHEKFNSACSFFKSSYFFANYDDIVTRMRNNLNAKYSRLSSGYGKISDWWNQYLTDVRNLESVLSHNGGYIQSGLVNNKVRMLQELADYDQNNDNFVYFNLSKTSKYTLKGAPSTDTIDPIYELMNCGYLRSDIVRLLRGEITEAELYKEIENDPDNTRRKMLQAAGMLKMIEQTTGVDYGHSIEDLSQRLKSSTSELKELNTKYSEYNNKMVELDSITYILECMLRGDNYNLDDIINNYSQAFGHIWVDEEGNKFCISSSFGDVSGVKNHGTESVTSFSQFKDTELMNEIRNIIGDKKGYQFDQATLDQLQKLYDKVSKEKEALKNDKDVLSLHDKIVKQNKEVYEQKQIYKEITSQIDHYFAYIDPYVNKKDFEQYNSSNTMSFNKEKLVKYTTSSEEAVSDNIAFNLVTDKNEQVELISAIINGDVKVVNTWQAEKKNSSGEIIEFAHYNPYIEGHNVVGDDMIANFARWSLVMSDSEVECFNYIYNKQGVDAAYVYLNNISKDLDERYLYERRRLDENWGHEHPILASVESVIITPVEGMHAAAVSMKAVLTGKDFYRTNVYSKGDIERGAVSADVHAKSEFLGNLYDTGMSIADSSTLMVLNLAMPGSSAVISPALMGSRAYVSTLNDALDRGIDAKSAVCLATFSSIAESAMEHFSATHLLKIEPGSEKLIGNALKMLADSGLDPATIKLASGFVNIIGNTLTQAICEGEEEFATEVVNYIADEIISGKLSNNSIDFQNYIMNGYDTDEAKKKAYHDTFDSWRKAFAGGFFSGLFFGGLESARSTHRICNVLANDFFEKYDNSNISIGGNASTQYEGTNKSLFADNILKAKEVTNGTELKSTIKESKIQSEIAGLNKSEIAKPAIDALNKQIEKGLNPRYIIDDINDIDIDYLLEIVNGVSDNSKIKFEVGNKTCNVEQLMDIINGTDNSQLVNSTIEELNRQIAAGLNPRYIIDDVNNIDIDSLFEILNGVSDNSKIQFEVGNRICNIEQLMEIVNGEIIDIDEKYSVVTPLTKMIKLYGMNIAYDMIMNNNYSAIVNEELRNSISGISENALTDFLVDMRNLDLTKQTMINKYGEAGLNNFMTYLENGDISLVTRDNNARTIAETMSEQSREAYQAVLRSVELANDNLALGTSNTIQGRNELNNFFASVGNFNEGTYGIDQACIEKMCEYELNGDNYSYQEAKNMVNNAIAQETLIPRFRKIGVDQYFELKEKLMKKGFSDDESSVILSSIDDAGACSYAAAINMMLYKFRNNESLFEETFGYSMYRNENGAMVFNEELLLDLYVFANDTANGGRFFTNNHLNKEMLSDTIDVYGRNILDSKRQVFMSSVEGFDAKLLTEFLNSKYSGLYATSKTIVNNFDAEALSNDQIINIVNSIDDQLNKNKSVQLAILSHGSEIRMQAPAHANYDSVSTETWDEGDGHAVTITGITESSFLVSSWGRAYFIPFEDLSGGSFGIDSLDIYNLGGNKLVNDTINVMNRQIKAGMNPTLTFEHINDINLDNLLEIVNGVSDNSKIRFSIENKLYNVDELMEIINGGIDANSIIDWNSEVNNYNRLSQQQDKVVYKLSSLDDIPKDFINSVNDPTKLVFSVNNVEYTIDDLKRVPDSKQQTDNMRHTAKLDRTIDEVIDLDSTSELDNTIDEEIKLRHTAKLNEVIDEVDNLRHTAKLDEVVNEINNLDNTIDEVIDLDGASNKSTYDNEYWDSEVGLCNMLAKKGQVKVYELSNFDEIPIDFINKLDDPTVLRFIIGDKVYNVDDLKGIKVNNQQQTDNIRHTAELSDTLELDETADLSEDIQQDQIDYSAKIDEIRTYLDNKIQETSNRNISDLKEQLMNSVEDIDDPLARARKLYLELNKNLSYNETYSALTYIDNTELIDEILDNANNSTANLDNLIDDKVICIEWAQLYYDTLISAGFSPDDVMIKGDSGHKWVTLKLPNGKVVIADATDSMEGSYDLANSRLGDETRGFVITGVENANLRLTDNKALTSQLLADQYSQIRELDRSIKYTNENGYFSDQVREYARLSGMMDANYDPTEMFMECLEAEIPSTYTGQEAWIYFRKVAINIYNYGIIKEHMKNSLYPLFINGKLEIMNEVSFEYNGKTLYRFYSESTGNHIFDNAADRDAYKATLETFERGDM